MTSCEIRIAARPRPDVDKAEIRPAASCAARSGLDSGTVRVDTLSGHADGDCRRDVVVRVNTDLEAMSAAYASAAWGLAHCLADSLLFEAVAADVPVTAYQPPDEGVGAFGSHDCRDNSNDPAWALDVMRFRDADRLLPDALRGGAGVRIGHPDSGWTPHPALGDAVEHELGWDVIDDDPDSTDPMDYDNAFPAHGHGTATASVIAGRGVGDGFHGMAPSSTIVPFRALESVIQFFDSDVAKAVHRARAAGCHIVSMSLGGTGFFGLRDAIDQAVASGMIVMAAAGNKARVVTAPAYYDNCLAVAAVMPGDVPWPGTSRGDAVDVAAPGGCVHVARTASDPAAKPQYAVRRGHGTSYAVAHLAGAAALWLARWGHDELCQTYGRGNVQAVFLHQLREHGCHRPPGWQRQFGIGRVDAFALVNADLPRADDFRAVGAFGARDTPVSRLAALADTTETQIESALSREFGDAHGVLAERFEGELAHLMLSDDSFLDRMTGIDGPGAFGAQPPKAASPQLAAALS